MINKLELDGERIDAKHHTEKDWKYYISTHGYDRKVKSKHNQARLELCKYFQKLESSGRTLFHMITTYIDYPDREYQISDVNKFFTNYYLRNFLKTLLKTNDYTTDSNKLIQPICWSFLDEGASKHKDCINHSTGELTKVFPLNLHHHSILAIHPVTASRMVTFLGTNMIPIFNEKSQQWTKKIQSVHIEMAEPMTVLYASKIYAKPIPNTNNKYSDESLQFPSGFKPIAEQVSEVKH